MNVKYKTIIIILVIIASFIRLYSLGSVPASLNWDEISHGYNAFSVSQTLKDQWGTLLPVFNFRAYGDYPTTLNLYLTIPFIKMFGLNALSIRLPTALFSIIYIISAYLLTHQLFKNKYLSIIVTLLASFSPWTFFSSRGVFQSTISQTLLLLSTYTFFRGLTNPRFLILFSLFISLSTYSYHNARIIAPLLTLWLLLTYRQKLRQIYAQQRWTIITSIQIFLLILLPNSLNLFSPGAFARNRWIGIINPNSINLINEQRRLFDGPQFLNRIVNNKVVYFSKTLTINYLNLFNPYPLFFHGTDNQQLAVPNTGIMFAYLLPFFYYGLYISIKTPKYRYLILPCIISLLPSALTVGDFPVLRASSASIFYFIFISIGIYQFHHHRLLLYVPLGLIFVVSVVLYLSKYSKYTYQYSHAWQYGYQATIDYVKSNYDNYDKIYVTKKYGEPHEFFLFYWPWNPSLLWDDPNYNWDYHADWYWVNSFDKFIFVNDWDISPLKLQPNSLLITSPKNYPDPHPTVNKTINFLNGTPAFDIVSYE